MLSELSALQTYYGAMKSNDNEIEILKSRTLVESTVRKLNLRTRVLLKEILWRKCTVMSQLKWISK
jgi:hypothetical protein